MTETGDANMDDGQAAVLGAGEGGVVDFRAAALARSADRSAAGRRVADFDDIVRRHERSVLRLARRLLGHAADAEDAAQEAFLKLYRALDRLDPERPVLPYLYRVTVNVCRDLGRRRRGGRGPDHPGDTVPLDELPPSSEPLAAGADPARAAHLAEERRIAETALRALPEKQRAALVLRDVHGLTTREVAEALGVAEVTVRTQISRARLKVKEMRDSILKDGRKTP